MNNSMLTDKELKQLKDFLPRGSYTKIARNINVSLETVRQVLNSNWYNADVFTEAFRLAELEKKRRTVLANKIKSVID